MHICWQKQLPMPKGFRGYTKLSFMTDNDFINVIADRVAINTKEVWTIEDTATYTGLSKSQLYKLAQAHVLPYSKPSGKVIFFKREDVINWLLSNRYASAEEIADTALQMTKRAGSGAR